MSLYERLRRTRAIGRPSRVVTSDRFEFDGGLNLVDPPLVVRPGRCLGAKNYFPGIRGGYTRTSGYERFDGRPSPTTVTFYAFTYGAAPAGFQALMVEGATLASNGPHWSTILYHRALTATTGYVVIYVVGGISDWFGQIWNISDPTKKANLVEKYFNSGATDALSEEFRYHVTDYQRSVIGTVGGASCIGPVLAVKVFNGDVYAIRELVSPPGKVGIFRALATGWVQVFPGTTPSSRQYRLAFFGGVRNFTEGMTLRQPSGGSAFTCIVRRIVITDGTVKGGDASGYLTVTDVTGTISAGADLFENTNKVCTAQFASPLIEWSINAGGTYRWREHNFAGFENRKRLYGVNGVGNAFEFSSGGYVTLIETGMPIDAPTHIAVLNDHLVLGFPGGSVQNSGYQQPLNFNPIVGADERSAGGDIVMMQEETNRTLYIATRQQTFVFYGDVVENFQFRLYAPENGAIENTVGRLGHTIYLDDRGFVTLKAAAEFGNFELASISKEIEPLVRRILSNAYPIGVVVSKRLNLYRIVFSDGAGLAIGIRPGGKLTGWMPFALSHTPTCFDSSEIEVEFVYNERSFMGCTDGYVRELDIGRSFDGLPIEAFLRLSYHHSGTPEVIKRYRRAQIDVEISGKSSLRTTVDYNYGLKTGQTAEEREFTGGGGFWNIDNWNEFLWSQPGFDQEVMKIEGSGYNIGFFFYSRADDQVPVTLYGVSLQHSRRRINRGTVDT